jgi:ketosteroid isomerase-like protein
MSQENVEVVRQIYAAVERGDAASVIDLYDPEVEWDFTDSPFRIFVSHDMYRGHGGLRTFIRDRYEDAWASIEDHLDELIDAGDHVVSLVTSVGRGRLSGAPAERAHAGVWTLREGKVVRAKWYSSREQALEAVGLAES